MKKSTTQIQDKLLEEKRQSEIHQSNQRKFAIWHSATLPTLLLSQTMGKVKAVFNAGLQFKKR